MALEYDDVTLTLENDGEFYRKFCAATPGIFRRDTIRNAITRLYSRADRGGGIGLESSEVAAMEEYFDERWMLVATPKQFVAPIEVQPNEGKTMAITVPNIEVKTFVGGIDSKDVSDDAIFSQIKSIEDIISQLDKTDNKPKKLVAKIESLKADIAALVAFVDAR